MSGSASQLRQMCCGKIDTAMSSRLRRAAPSPISAHSSSLQRPSLPFEEPAHCSVHILILAHTGYRTPSYPRVQSTCRCVFVLSGMHYDCFAFEARNVRPEIPIYLQSSCNPLHFQFNHRYNTNNDSPNIACF